MAGSVDEKTDEEFPIQLLTTRKVYEYAGGAMTRRSKTVEQGGDAVARFFEVRFGFARAACGGGFLVRFSFGGFFSRLPRASRTRLCARVSRS